MQLFERVVWREEREGGRDEMIDEVFSGSLVILREVEYKMVKSYTMKDIRELVQWTNHDKG